jgi:bifunctional non-homologous end joining protein LigD
MGLEGLVSKRRDQPYQAGRSPHWLKIKNRKHSALSRECRGLQAFRGS